MWGVVFEIPDDEVSVLDKSEGYSPGRGREKNAYERLQLDVFPQGSNASPITVWTYVVVNRLKSAPKPSAEYKATILAGARHWKLPADYVEERERIETQWIFRFGANSLGIRANQIGVRKSADLLLCHEPPGITAQDDAMASRH